MTVFGGLSGIDAKEMYKLLPNVSASLIDELSKPFNSKT